MRADPCLAFAKEIDTISKVCSFATSTPTKTEISKGSIVEYIYDGLLELYQKYDQLALRGRILQCLGTASIIQP